MIVAVHSKDVQISKPVLLSISDGKNLSFFRVSPIAIGGTEKNRTFDPLFFGIFLANEKPEIR